MCLGVSKGYNLLVIVNKLTNVQIISKEVHIKKKRTIKCSIEDHATKNGTNPGSDLKKYEACIISTWPRPEMALIVFKNW